MFPKDECNRLHFKSIISYRIFFFNEIYTSKRFLLNGNRSDERQTLSQLAFDVGQIDNPQQDDKKTTYLIKIGNLL